MSTSGGGTPAVPTGPAGGDLSGGYPAPVVSQVQGRPVSNAAPAGSQAFVWSGALWLPSAIVNNFAGRTGGIVPTTGDYTAAQVTGAADKSAVATQAFAATVTAPLLGTSNGINLATGSVGVVNPCIYYDGNFMYLSTAAGKGVKTPGGGNTLDDGAGNMAAVGSIVSNGVYGVSPAGVVALRPNGSASTHGQMLVFPSGAVETSDSLGAVRNVLDDGAGNAGFSGHIQTVFNLIPGNGAAAGGGLWGGAGAPAAGLGANGDFYFRTDGAASTRIYYKSGGVWAGIV